MRQWKDDLWLFPYYTNKSKVPKDVASGLAAGFWPDEIGSSTPDSQSPKALSNQIIIIVISFLGLLILGGFFLRKK